MQSSVLQLKTAHGSGGCEHYTQMSPFLQLVIFYLTFTSNGLLVGGQKHKEHLCLNAKQQ